MFDFVLVAKVSRHFRDILCDLPALQCQRELFSAGLSDNPRVSCDFSQRRKACEDYAHKWSDAGRVVGSVHELPLEKFSESHAITILGGNLVASRGSLDNSLTFVRVPSAMSRTPIEWWSIPPFSYRIKTFATYLPDNILAVAEEKDQ